MTVQLSHPCWPRLPIRPPSPEGVAYLLVGVEEHKDPVSGLVAGVPFGLPDLEKAVARRQDRARTTCPVPIDMFIVEEGVEGPRPFLRVEVRATMAPHYDQEAHTGPAGLLHSGPD